MDAARSSEEPDRETILNYFSSCGIRGRRGRPGGGGGSAPGAPSQSSAGSERPLPPWSPAVAAEAQRGLVADGVALEGRFQEQVPHDAGRELLLHQVEDVAALRARRADEVACVCGCLVQEAGDGVVGLVQY